MDWSLVIAEIPKAVPILTGGLVAIAAGAVTQYFTHRFTRQRDHERRLREKAEALIEAM